MIGKVVEGDRLKIIHNGELKADLPVLALTDEAPKYDRPMVESERSKAQRVTVQDHGLSKPRIRTSDKL